jgi:cation diffusion facilitator family transporter
MALENSAKVNAVLKAILFFNLLVLAIKVVIGIKSQSLSIIGDAVHSGVDSANNLVGIMAISLAAEPPDEEHPYGHGKFETLGALAVVGFLAIASFEIVEKSVMRFLHPIELPYIEDLTLYCLLATLIINIGVWAYEKNAGRKYHSQILLADAEHTWSDILITAFILLSAFFMLKGHYWLDPLLGIVVAILVFKSAVDILRSTVPILVDEAWLTTEDISAIVASTPKAAGFSGLSSRKGRYHSFLEMTVQFNTDSLSEAHTLSHEIERQIIEKFGDANITIHIEPAE